MKVKRFILSVALPLFLAAVILSLGNMIPNNLLERQKENYIQRLTTVEIDDVRPYGDEYEENRQGLLTSIRVLEDAHYVDRESTAVQATSIENTMAGFVEFLRLIQSNADAQGQPVELLERLEYHEEGLISYGSEGSDMVLMLSLVDTETGMLTSCNLDLSTGAPVQLVMAGERADYVSPWVLWDAVCAAYQEHCGIIFGEPMSRLQADGAEKGANERALMEKLAEKFALNAENSTVTLSAVSNDMTFRLELSMETYEGETWNVALGLRRNDE